jgi:23S rRNA (guanosine2251-2'-O)-methyltransferase
MTRFPPRKDQDPRGSARRDPTESRPARGSEAAHGRGTPSTGGAPPRLSRPVGPAEAWPRAQRSEGPPRTSRVAPSESPSPRAPIPGGLDQLEGRNVVIEALLRARRRVRLIRLDERAKPDEKVTRMLALAEAAKVKIERVDRNELDAVCESGVHNGVIAWAEPLPGYTTQGLLSELERQGKEPFVLLVDEISYEQNLGAILRSALGAGVNAVIVPVQRGKGLTPVVHRVAMGGAEAVPLIREGLSSALATLRRAGVRIVGADMDGAPCWEVPMVGSLAIVLGGEGKGLTHTLRERCDALVSVPLQGDLESLNVSVTAGILAFERVRQTTHGAPAWRRPASP